MEEVIKKENVCMGYKLFHIEAIRVSNGTFAQREEKVSGVLFLNARLYNVLKVGGKISYNGYFIDIKNENIVCAPFLKNISSLAELNESDKEYAYAMNLLDDYGLKIASEQRVFTWSLLTDWKPKKLVVTEIQDNICFVSRDSIKFKLGGKYLTYEELAEYPIEDGYAIKLVYDNGYSYMREYPIGKDAFLKAIDDVATMRFQSVYDDIRIQLDKECKQIYVNVTIGKDETYSEITNS